MSSKLLFLSNMSMGPIPAYYFRMCEARVICWATLFHVSSMRLCLWLSRYINKQKFYYSVLFLFLFLFIYHFIDDRTIHSSIYWCRFIWTFLAKWEYQKIWRKSKLYFEHALILSSFFLSLSLPPKKMWNMFERCWNVRILLPIFYVHVINMFVFFLFCFVAFASFVIICLP